MVYVKEFLQAFEVLFWQIIGKKKHTKTSTNDVFILA